MVLELHVWGPAFALPSIDAQCLAAIAYLSQAVPRGEWELIASSDPTLSPTNELPALRNGAIWIGGFRNIIDYISQLSAGKWSLDADLEGLEKADCTAYSSFIELHGQELLDLSLYVSSANYVDITRPLYNTIQSFPLPYLTPPAIRAAAKKRTDHLGLSSLDLDSEAERPQEKSIIPESLRKPRATVSSLLQEKPENAAQIRLDALATSFYQPLHELRGGKKFFIGQTITSLDCLALGYLALCLYPDLPSPWLAKCMRNKFPRLAAFVHDLQSTIYGRVTLEDAGLTSVHDEAVLRARGKGMLPWKAPDNGGLAAVGAAFATNLVDSIPIVSQFRRENRIEKEMESEAENDEERQAVAELAAYKRRELFMNIGSVIAGVGLFIGFIFQQGLIAIGSAAEEVQLEEKGGLEQYGEAGAALAALAQQMDFEVNMQKAWENEGSGVEVDVEVVPDRVQ